MEMTVQIPFQQLLKLIKGLTPAEKETIRQELADSEPKLKKNDDFMEFLLNGPVYSDEDIAMMEENRKSIAEWRTND
jgi:uncharacterized protein YeeX (DUF496 family)